MIQAAVVARLAVRELWIGYRLLLILVAFIAAGAAVALLPAALSIMLLRLAVGLGLATALAGAIAAWSISDERRRGRAAWLVSCSVSRGTILVAWFVAIAVPVVVAMTASSLLGWLAASSASVGLVPAGFVSLTAGVVATGLAAVALGLLVGVVLPVRTAIVVVVAICALLAAAVLFVPLDPALVPGGAFVALANLTEPGRAIAPGLRAAGVGLATTAALLAAARVALERVEL